VEDMQEEEEETEHWRDAKSCHFITTMDDGDRRAGAPDSVDRKLVSEVCLMIGWRFEQQRVEWNPAGTIQNI